VKACHDCSEGGIGVAAAEMAFAGGLGMKLDLSNVPLEEAMERDDFTLFSESNSRFIVEVAPENADKFEKTLKGIACAAIGKVTKDNRFKVNGQDGAPLLSVSIKKMKEAWQQPLRW
jgi:phosphoribosylformylglycinamidine synthase